MQIRGFIIIFIVSFLSLGCSAFLSDSLQMDLNDILRSDLMPTTFLMFDGVLNSNKAGAISVEQAEEEEIDVSARQGGAELGSFTNPTDWSVNNASAAPLVASAPPHNLMNALSTMRFHR